MDMSDGMGSGPAINLSEYMSLEHLNSLMDMRYVRSALNCTGDCAERFEEWQHHIKWNCNGVPDLGAGGNWIGHFWPGPATR